MKCTTLELMHVYIVKIIQILILFKELSLTTLFQFYSKEDENVINLLYIPKKYKTDNGSNNLKIRMYNCLCSPGVLVYPLQCNMPDLLPVVAAVVKPYWFHLLITSIPLG